MRRLLLLAVASASLIAVIAAPLVAGDGARQFSAKLDGFNESPSVSTTGRGSFSAKIVGSTIEWRLSYRGPFNGAITQAHVHLGQVSVNGGISVFMCTNLGNGPATAPTPQACPAAVGNTPVNLSGTWTAADVGGPAGQGIAVGEFDELVRAIRAGVTYANVHSTTQPGGEIRGRVTRNDDDDD